MNVLVVGATGRVGRELIPQLLQNGARVTAVTRRAGTADLPAGAAVLEADASETVGAFTWPSDVDSLFLTPRAVGAALENVLRRAREREVTRAVLISSLTVGYGGGEPRFVEQFRRAEDAVKASGIEWTIVRCADFDANARVWIPQVLSSNVVHGAYGEAATASIHERDIAAVAALAFADRRHAHETYTLTGPERLSQREKVRLIGDAIGKELTWDELPPEDVRHAMIAAGVPPEIPARMLGYLASAADKKAPCTRTVRELLGRDALAFSQWARENAAAFLA